MKHCWEKYIQMVAYIRYILTIAITIYFQLYTKNENLTWLAKSSIRTGHKRGQSHSSIQNGTTILWFYHWHYYVRILLINLIHSNGALNTLYLCNNVLLSCHNKYFSMNIWIYILHTSCIFVITYLTGFCSVMATSFGTDL